MDSIFLKIAELEGSATSVGFEGQIGLLSMSHGLSLDCFSGGGTEGRTSGVSRHNDVVFTKVMDKNSVKFNEFCCNVTPVPETVFTITRQKGDKLEPLVIYTLTDVLVSSYSVSAGQGNPVETVSFNYSTIKWEFTEQNTDGTKSGNVSASWDVQKNTPAE